MKDLIFNPPAFDEEIKIRQKITPNSYNLSTIIVIENKLNGKFEIVCDSKVYDDTQEVLLTKNP